MPVLFSTARCIQNIPGAAGKLKTTFIPSRSIHATPLQGGYLITLSKGVTMRNEVFASLLLSLAFHVVNVNAQQHCSTRQVDAIVSTQWLADHAAEVLIVDVRSPEAYAADHIPGASNAPFYSWWVTRNNLLLEMPDDDVLRATIGECGISATSNVVLVGSTASDYDRAYPPRVAITLIYGGIKSVSILDGGIEMWTTEQRPLTTDTYTPPVVVYTGIMRKEIIVDRNYVEVHSRDARIVDARVPGDYFGVNPLEFSTKAGHIPGAVSLPTPWLFASNFTFRTADDLAAMFQGVIGGCPFQRVIVYCGVGGFASTTWFILSEVLGYQKVRMYDGSIQDWTSDPDAPVIKYSWTR